ncbi:hypothetical protein Glove_374g48 [Diversispora epigaea]|uniref:Uncharacterized protein n=1 Tax=Diversispora epigaea TaxID=1348612 RepID=A0A397HA77_9GLOM|nr:hypothetical protein Glove_374g48 [Diversispora epigaea]
MASCNLHKKIPVPLPLCLLVIPSREDDTLLETISLEYAQSYIDARQKPGPKDSEAPSLDVVKITRKYLMSRILDTCADVLHSAFDHMAPLNRFDLASSSDINKCSWHIDFLKSLFSLRLLGSAKKGRVKRPAFSSVKFGRHKEKCQSLTDENELSQKAKLLKNMTGLQSEILLEVLSDSTIRLTLKSYPDFLSTEKTTTLILEISGFRICNYQDMQGELSINEWDIIIVEVKSLFQCNAFIVVKNIQVIDNKYQPRIGKRVEFVSTGAVMARALMERASKLIKQDNSPIKSHFSDINTAWNELDRVAYTNTVEAGISFAGHFDIVIALQISQLQFMLKQNSRFSSSHCFHVLPKNSNELFRPLGHENMNRTCKCST